MSRKITLLLLVILQLSTLTVSATTNCCIGRSSSDVEMVNDCTNCNTECDCSTENCSECQGFEKCCQTCCEQRCDCRSLNCNSCSSQSNQCCANCCNSKCRSSRSSCFAKQCSQCNCDTCGVKQIQQQQQLSCCNSCCKQKEKIENNPAPSTNISQITTLPNITIIINHAPIYVNNTPVINTENRCGNASVLSNGTHIVYVYPQNSSCSNRTCCTRQVQQPCRPRLFMPPACPPPMNVPDCSARCFLPQIPPPPQHAPCQYFQTWPFVHCPQTGCYGLNCAPPVPMPPPPMMVQGCIPVPTWPFMRCIPGMGSESVVSYGPPSYQVVGPAGSSGVVPLSSTDHSAAYLSAGVPIGPSPPGYGMSMGP